MPTICSLCSFTFIQANTFVYLLNCHLSRGHFLHSPLGSVISITWQISTAGNVKHFLDITSVQWRSDLWEIRIYDAGKCKVLLFISSFFCDKSSGIYLIQEQKKIIYLFSDSDQTQKYKKHQEYFKRSRFLVNFPV